MLNSREKQWRTWRFLAIAMISLISIGIAFWGYHKLTSHPQKAIKNNRVATPLVRVKTIHSQKSMHLIIEGYGRVRASRSLQIRPQVSGKITFVHRRLKTGNLLQKGELLLQIDRKDYLRKIEQATNRVLLHKAELACLQTQKQNLLHLLKTVSESERLVQFELKRMQKLQLQNSLSERELYQEQQKFLAQRERREILQNALNLMAHKFKKARIAIKEAQSQLQKSKEEKKRTSIYVPFTARIKSTRAVISAIVTSTTIIAVLEDITPLEIAVHLPLHHACKLFDRLQPFSEFAQNNLQLLAQITSTHSNITQTWKARAVRLEPLSQNYTLPVIVEVDNNKQLSYKPSLQIGSFVKVRLQGQQVKNVFVLPLAWLRENNTVHTVKNNFLQIKKVRIVHRMASKVIIDQGLKDGETIVISQLPFLIPGMILRIQKETKS